MTGDRVRVGLVGTGKFARCHTRVWKGIGGVTLVGVHGSDRGRLEEFSRECGIASYEEYDRLIGEVDIIDVVSANDRHCEDAGRAIEKGRKVIIEKPLDASYERARAFYDRLESKGTSDSVISQLRFQGCFRELKRLLDGEDLGKVESCRVCVVWPRGEKYFAGSGGWRQDRSRAGGGVLIHQCIHFVDLLHWFFGSGVAVAGRASGGTGWVGHASGGVVERSFWGEIEFGTGTICQMYLTTSVVPYSRTEVEVFGSEGTAAVVDNRLYRGGRGWGRAAVRNMVPLALERLRRPENSDELLRRQFLDVLAAAERGRSPLVSVRDGLVALHTVEALYEAAECGKRIPLKNLAEELPQ